MDDAFYLETKGDINQINSIDILNIIKSNYILQNIFNNLEKKKLLNFIKYNKKIKKRMNMNMFIKDIQKLKQKLKQIIIKMSNILILIKIIKNIFTYILKIIKEK